MANPENISGQGFHTNPERINKLGRPKGKSLTTQLRELGNKLAPVDLRNKENIREMLKAYGMKGANIEIMLIQLYIKAITEGNLKAIIELFDRIEGKARQTIQYEGEVQIDVQAARTRLIQRLSEKEDVE